MYLQRSGRSRRIAGHEGLFHSQQEADNLHRVLAIELLQGRVQKVDLALNLLEREVGIWVDLRCTVCEKRTAIFDHRTQVV